MRVSHAVNAKCFRSVSPLLDNKLFDSFDAFTLGHAIGKSSTRFFRSIIGTFEKFVVLKKVYQLSQQTLEPVYWLMLEDNWDIVLHAQILRPKPSSTTQSRPNRQKTQRATG